jgi:hypothetical protein
MSLYRVWTLIAILSAVYAATIPPQVVTGLKAAGIYVAKNLADRAIEHLLEDKSKLEVNHKRRRTSHSQSRPPPPPRQRRTHSSNTRFI